VAGRASIVGAAATHVGKVRDHNEDAHFMDLDLGVFLVCDGMGGHAAGEVASALAIRSIRQEWASDRLRAVMDYWIERGTPEAKKQLLEVVRAGVVAAHDLILAEAKRDEAKSGMGTTLVGAMVMGGELVFAHAGDSRAYLVRDGISMQLTEDHTLLARLLAAGIDVDVSGEGARFRSMLTNALGIGDECKVSSFVVPLADGDQFLLCSDGITEYVPENEIGDILTRLPSPDHAAQWLIDLALDRGGGDNATAVVVRVLEAGETPLPADQRKKDDAAVASCALWGARITPQRRLRALRIAIPRDFNPGERLSPHALGDRVAWIIIQGELVQDGLPLGPGALVYPESLVNTGEPAAMIERDARAVTRSEVRALAFRADDFRELCEDDVELGEALLESLAQVISRRKLRPAVVPVPARPPVDPRGGTDPLLRVVASDEATQVYHPADPGRSAPEAAVRERASTVPDDEPTLLRAAIPIRPEAESPIIPPAPQRPSSPGLRSPAAPPLPGKRSSQPLPVAPPLPGKRPSQPLPAAPGASARRPSQPLPAAPGASARRPSQPLPAAPGASARLPSQPLPAAPGASVKRPSQPLPAPPSRPSSPLTKRSTVPPAPGWPGAGAEPLHSAPTLPHIGPAAPAPATPGGEVTRRVTPVGGIPPLARPETSPKPSTPVRGSTPPAGISSPQAPRSARPESGLGHVIARNVVKGFAPAATPPSGTPSGAMSGPARGDLPPGKHATIRPSTEPEIEAYVEIEAELPPEPGSDAEASEHTLDLAALGDDEHETVSIVRQDSNTRVTEIVTETDSQTLTLTVTEPPADDPARSRPITGQDGVTVAGTIEDRPDPSRRARRHSEGYED
jgi:serine/threonine protein phosphatase PrpC